MYYPDDPRPAVSAFAAVYKARYGFDVNFLSEIGYTAAQFVLAALDKAGRDLTGSTASLLSIGKHAGLSRHLHSLPLTITPTNHHVINQSFLTVRHNGRLCMEPGEPLGH